jgi:hypothetical protein
MGSISRAAAWGPTTPFSLRHDRWGVVLPVVKTTQTEARTRWQRPHRHSSLAQREVALARQVCSSRVRVRSLMFIGEGLTVRHLLRGRLLAAAARILARPGLRGFPGKDSGVRATCADRRLHEPRFGGGRAGTRPASLAPARYPAPRRPGASCTRVWQLRLRASAVMATGACRLGRRPEAAASLTPAVCRLGRAKTREFRGFGAGGGLACGLR